MVEEDKVAWGMERNKKIKGVYVLYVVEVNVRLAKFNMIICMLGYKCLLNECAE